MKEQILAKIKILMEVKESSYIIHDGNDYHGICDEIKALLDKGIQGALSYTDYMEVIGELNKAITHARKVKQASLEKNHLNSHLN
jgi:hypothetical protein